jgi:hypothetical protein
MSRVRGATPVKLPLKSLLAELKLETDAEVPDDKDVRFF